MTGFWTYRGYSDIRNRKERSVTKENNLKNDHGDTSSPGVTKRVGARPRLATAADIPSIIALERSVPQLVHWSEQTYRNVFESANPERRLWVIEPDGKLQAFLVARFSAADCELENLVVAESERRRGRASELLSTLIEVARERNLERILLEVRESNRAARALYERLGFQPNARRKAYYSQPREDAILFALLLDCTSSSALNR